MKLKARVTTGGILDVSEKIFLDRANEHLSTPSGEKLLLGLKNVSGFDYEKYFQEDFELGNALTGAGIINRDGLTNYGREVIANYEVV
ncbi:hypothetical protein HYT56_03735 [Candidatus Woesearchaeota archaeon]|nr:hypothetical protein [Candidatus Woesearchaeota archaeon]